MNQVGLVNFSRLTARSKGEIWLILTKSLCLGFEHSKFVFAQEANMHENKFKDYRIPSGMLVVFLEKALTLIHMETHLDDVSKSRFLPKNSPLLERAFPMLLI